ncbi:MAG: fused MFS/spermidine synthase [Acidimicrobiales bacterium]
MRPSFARDDVSLLVLLVASLFLTGACGLLYQQLWLRELSLVFGMTVQAAAVALAVFMGGLALGARLAGRLADRTRRPVAWYGASEAVVGVLAVLTPPAMALTTDLYAALAGIAPDSTPYLTVLRVVLAFVVLLVPATVMGASTPLVVSAASRRSGRVGQRTGLLYAANTFGAIAGAVYGGLRLIGGQGVTTSFRLGAAVNLGVGIVVIVASRRFDRQVAAATIPAATPGGEPGPTGTKPAPVAATTPAPVRRLVLATFVVSGFATFSLEVVWFRSLSLYLESSVYAFAAMLSVVLVGLAAGSALVTPLLGRPRPWLPILGVVQFFAGVSALASLWLLDRADGLLEIVQHLVTVDRTSSRYTLLLAAVAVGPASLLLGAAFPIGARLYAEGRDHTGDAVGRFYGGNTLGAIVGSLTAGFVLLPAFGSRATVAIPALALVATSLALLWRSPLPRPVVPGAALVAVAVVAVGLPDPSDAALAQRFPGSTLVAIEEGRQGTTWVIDQVDTKARHLYVDGLHQASSEPGVLRIHEQIALIPMAIHPAPARALVIGLGGGVTSGALSSVRGVEVDIVELSPEVVRAARWFGEWNDDVVDKPNVRIRSDDGRNRLLVSDERYDVITADIIQPRSPGAGKLWSIDYWRLVRQALAPGGIALQWVGASRNEVEYGLIVRSFLEVFPDATLWVGGQVLVGTNGPLRLDRPAIERKLADPANRALFCTVGVCSFDDLLAQYAAGPDDLRDFVGAGPVLDDDFPRIEYWRSLGVASDAPFVNLDPLLARRDPSVLLGP